MSSIKGKNTLPELLVRKALHAKGFRYLLHVKSLPGAPDLVFPRYKAIIFVHGCFWHQHGCSNSKMPGTRVEFWSTKLNGNKARDKAQVEKLLGQGWRVAIVWECSIRKTQKAGGDSVFQDVGHWLTASDTLFMQF